jgi:hypothetical protein
LTKTESKVEKGKEDEDGVIGYDKRVLDGIRRNGQD